ncbi:hypothetical protein [Algoriphagus winogradskyi]|uniref:Uncharacterized protein n=1 Tax=Algoriphagus winogradskyi TaxID=237017 RepID=A0ABY1NBM9_9BACT|nr:hypothetical protein [Algoriphagus winogradskyi]SMP05742.1 hypothetical protein SAMN06265367_101377 [Algoriphagus winogradskyi]
MNPLFQVNSLVKYFLVFCLTASSFFKINFAQQVTHDFESVKYNNSGTTCDNPICHVEELQEGFEKVRFNQWEMLAHEVDGEWGIVVSVEDGRFYHFSR